MLWVLAWSAVGFNLSGVYRPVMGALFTLQGEDGRPPVLSRAQRVPGIPWIRAREIGRELMAAEARTKGFRVLEAQELSYDPQTALYRYRVKSDRDIQDRRGATWVAFEDIARRIGVSLITVKRYMKQAFLHCLAAMD